MSSHAYDLIEDENGAQAMLQYTHEHKIQILRCF